MPPLLSRSLPEPPRLAFPFRIERGAPLLAGRAAHVRGIIEQVIFTSPGERVFRQGYGAGALQLVFEPAAETLTQTIAGRLETALAEALVGEVDPKSLEVEVSAAEAAAGKLLIRVAYALSAVRQREVHDFTLVGSGAGVGGDG